MLEIFMANKAASSAVAGKIRLAGKEQGSALSLAVIQSYVKLLCVPTHFSTAAFLGGYCSNIGLEKARMVSVGKATWFSVLHGIRQDVPPGQPAKGAPPT